MIWERKGKFGNVFLKVQVQKALPSSMILKFQCIVSAIKVIKMSTKNTYDMQNPCCFNYLSCLTRY